MLNGETWLVHSDLFKKHWVFETKSWARDLGWFDELRQLATDGWVLFGPQDLTPLDYITLVDAKNSEKTIYGYINGVWKYFDSPVLFIVKKNENETFIAGWAGDKKTIEKNKKLYDNPWDWKNINIIEVDPTIALVGNRGNPVHKKIPVFFTSNGETDADTNWERLVSVCPRAIRVDGINNRRDVFLRCAELSGNFSHFFVVTGKNFVTDKSVFDYVPDKTVPESHIMFQAKNMSNSLEYGHMAIGLYNTEIVRKTPESFGLDFTEWGKIYSVPKTVSEAHFATTPYEAWRTAFREAVKLTIRNTDISQSWLNRWTTFAQGPNSDWVLIGAREGKKYALDNKNNEQALLNTVSWSWLKQHFDSIHIV